MHVIDFSNNPQKHTNIYVYVISRYTKIYPNLRDPVRIVNSQLTVPGISGLLCVVAVVYAGATCSCIKIDFTFLSGGNKRVF